ncbi:cupredoxin domain-containing protein [Rhodopila sp.]|uniref:cupredoxin domain-containing protein n=1 Tax=Rhodopila sp. TaxID=2480087 RepID=UPI003D10E26B
MRTLLISFLATTVILASIAIAAAGGVAMVSQKSRAFSVSHLQIAHGDTVRFNNEDTFLHQIYVHSPSLNYESDEQEPGTSVEIRFPSAGTFEVRCQIHPKMLLVVEAR